MEKNVSSMTLTLLSHISVKVFFGAEPGKHVLCLDFFNFYSFVLFHEIVSECKIEFEF